MIAELTSYTFIYETLCGTFNIITAVQSQKKWALQINAGRPTLSFSDVSQMLSMKKSALWLIGSCGSPAWHAS